MVGWLKCAVGNGVGASGKGGAGETGCSQDSGGKDQNNGPVQELWEGRKALEPCAKRNGDERLESVIEKKKKKRQTSFISEG